MFDGFHLTYPQSSTGQSHLEALGESDKILTRRQQAKLIREALLAMARRCLERDAPYPKCACLERSYGRTDGTISAHLNWLQDRDLVAFQQRGRARYVVRVAA